MAEKDLFSQVNRPEDPGWLSGFRVQPKHLFVVHGEQHIPELFAKKIQENHDWSVSVPQCLDKATLN